MSAPAAVPAWLQRAALLIGLVGIVLSALGGALDLPAFVRSYFTALMVFWQLPLGCLAILISYHLMGGGWGIVIGDALEVGVRTLPLLALLFLPVLLDLHTLYPWTRPDYVAVHEVVARKAGYLNEPFFVLRSLAYLVIWIGLAMALTLPRRPLAERPLHRGLASIGAILYALTASFASVDWVMSLEPRFNSSIYGMLAMSAQAVAGFALAVLATLGVSEVEGRVSHLREKGLIGLGALLYGLILIWIYMAFMQLLVIWSGNLPDGAEWYLVRIEGIWRPIAWLIGIGHFALPFVIFLSSRARQSPMVVMGMAGVLLAMRFLDQLWLTLPAFRDLVPPAWQVIAALLAVGGIWLCAFLWTLERRAAWVAAAADEATRG